MSYTLATAAKATGLNKSTILRAIKGGQITGTKDQFGEWRIEPVELHRVYPAVADFSGQRCAAATRSADAAALDAEIEVLIMREIYSDNSTMNAPRPRRRSRGGDHGGGAFLQWHLVGLKGGRLICRMTSRSSRAIPADPIASGISSASRLESPPDASAGSVRLNDARQAKHAWPEPASRPTALDRRP